MEGFTNPVIKLLPKPQALWPPLILKTRVYIYEFNDGEFIDIMPFKITYYSAGMQLHA